MEKIKGRMTKEEIDRAFLILNEKIEEAMQYILRLEKEFEYLEIQEQLLIEDEKCSQN